MMFLQYTYYNDYLKLYVYFNEMVDSEYDSVLAAP